MTSEETAKILSLLRAAYPNFYKGMDKESLLEIVHLWHDMFCEDSVTLVAAAVKALIANDEKGFPPVIGQVRRYVHRIAHPNELDEMEAWGFVAKAVRNSAYHSGEEFLKLPPVVQRIVGDAPRLREWALMEAEVVQSVVMSGFLRSYRARAQQERERLAMPSGVQALSQRLAEGMGEKALAQGEDGG